jgi:hypothetical protein
LTLFLSKPHGRESIHPQIGIAIRGQSASQASDENWKSIKFIAIAREAMELDVQRILSFSFSNNH